MAIQKMKLVNIVGPVNDFDRVVSEYLLDFDIHIESSMSILNNVGGLVPFSGENNYAQPMAQLEELFEMSGAVPQSTEGEIISYEDAVELITDVRNRTEGINLELAEITKKLEQNALALRQLENLLSLNINLDDIFKFRFIKFRFGRMPRAGYKKLTSYLSGIDAFFIEGETEDDYVYGVYFMPAESEERIDGIFTSLYFERIMVSSESHGTPREAYERFLAERENLKIKENELKNNLSTVIEENKKQLAGAHQRLRVLNKTADIKRLSAHTRESFYIIGWTSEREADRIIEVLDVEPDVVLVEEEPGLVNQGEPPIKLKNKRIFRPFEMFVEMYGLPSYKEIDPTTILALTYALMFGIMFGDVGHGLVLLIGGLAFYKTKEADIGAIVAAAGVFSILFGFIYGSVFGFEDVLRGNSITAPLAFISPMHDINTVLIASVALGAVIIIGSMLLNIANAIKSRDWGRAFFDQSGVAGLVFYGYIIFTVANMFFHLTTVPKAVSVVCIGIPLLLILFKEPLSLLLKKQKNWIPSKKGEYFLEAFFELFEILLSYATNTISFVRLGAFALGHASMMSVVFILGGMSSGAGYYITLILGNLLVIGLEGLVVGIQALRLEFYEMFSRYYTGGGRAFKSIKYKVID